MKRISCWAKNHVWQSRLLIVVIYILLNVIGMFTGRLLNELEVILPALYFTVCLIVAGGLLLGYPKKTRRNVSSSALYFRRKLYDFSLGAITFLMIVYLGNNWQRIPLQGEFASATKLASVVKDSAANYNHDLLKNFIADIKSRDVGKLSQRQKSTLLRDQVKKINKDKELSPLAKAGLIFLSVIVALALLFGLAGLSCSIACSGSEALALIVLAAGTFLIIFFSVRLISNILKPGRRLEKRKLRMMKREQNQSASEQ